ncbi:uncharacterized protein Z520_06322 [Fonsecaea multimorphosa CBS 102226]|uniref:MICOS complex subunit MIC12 n=1 Tax=Fonsecaea multimorphosa CBS 102226 TaxID=1442371 RepID=A0A0D2JXG0_9EURO|nr:uncharacterized protein Z520_06322 [Fonsecaea multimorphosa CBS 102226]KIX98242.1 hypothetical protein Z520_06322 [Fonsecaea multimorphosa CBS 102226]OAL22624.1 hypothetical protein AYO22_07182 [Fonsecaea multimorphosa]
MGFTTGFLGGATLTYSLLYLSLYVHRANRNVQRTLLSQQATLLNSVVEPAPPLPDPPAYEVRRAGIIEELKDRWNREVARIVKNVEETDWSSVREDVEEKVGNVWARMRQSQTGKEVEDKVKEVVDVGKEKVDELVGAGKQKVKEETTQEPTRLLELK